MKRPMTTTMTLIAVVIGAASLAACHPRQQAANEGTDSTMAQRDDTTRDSSANASATADRLRGDAREAARDTKDAVTEAGQKVGDKVNDAVITTTVKAELAKDSNLSALRINVDTDSGHVQLRGTAPSDQARDRATTLAQGVKGVTSVDNQLTVEPNK